MGAQVARGALGLLRVAGRLLVYKEAAADGILASLQLLPRLNASVARDLAPPLAAQARSRPHLTHFLG